MEIVGLLWVAKLLGIKKALILGFRAKGWLVEPSHGLLEIIVVCSVVNSLDETLSEEVYNAVLSFSPLAWEAWHSLDFIQDLDCFEYSMTLLIQTSHPCICCPCSHLSRAYYTRSWAFRSGQWSLQAIAHQIRPHPLWKHSSSLDQTSEKSLHPLSSSKFWSRTARTDNSVLSGFHYIQ